jgi:hypothetical protein
VEYHFEAQAVTEHVELRLKHGAQLGGGIDVQTSRTPQQSEGGDHAYQTKTMIAMKMGDEDMTQLGKTHMTLAQLHLGALGTIEHQHLVTHLHHL